MSFALTLKNTLMLLGMSGLSVAGTIPLRRGDATASDAASARLMGSSPQLEYDPNTTPDCTWWYDNAQATNCNDMLAGEGVTLANFRRWNPSINAACTNLAVGRSYCVEAAFETVPTPAEPETPPATTTAPSNGITTPQPPQPSMVENCNKFYFVKSGDSCATIASNNGITLANFLAWNKAAGSNCGGLWANAHACVGVVGGSTNPSPTNPGNGIATPQPPQPSMVENCNKFYFVKSGDSCATIASNNGITLANFLAWNKAAGSNCGGLWANAHACVGVVGGSTTPSPTNPGNGIATPQPPQPSMVGNCSKFYFVKSGDSCATIASSNGITLANFLAWNKAAGSNCGGLWANAHACVGVVGGTTPNPSPTNPGNGIQTPTPIQAGMTASCKTFHFVTTGQTCDIIASRYRVTVANLVRWNPAIGSGCNSMWANAYLCVAVL